jgi:hypothetical protein
MVLSWFRKWSNIRVVLPHPARRRSTLALRLERLEDRVVPVAFGPPTHYGAGSGPSFVVAAHFHGGPGTMDMAVSNLNSNSVSVFLNNADGTGTFQPAVNYAAGTAPIFMTVGDLFGDGKQDLVVSNYTSPMGTVTILRGNGDGTFQAPMTLPLGDDLPETVLLADLNGDGLLDIVTANFSSAPTGTVSVLLNNGDGTFAPAVTYPAGNGPYGLAVADLYGDGFPSVAVSDIAAGGGTSNINVLRGNGDGTFQPFQTKANLPDRVPALAAGNLGNGAGPGRGQPDNEQRQRAAE